MNKKIKNITINNRVSIYILDSSDVNYENINDIMSLAGGLLNVFLPQQVCDKLDIPKLGLNTAGFLALTSVEAKNNISTGISCQDRLTTIQTLINPQVKKNEISMPGHIFPYLFCSKVSRSMEELSKRYDESQPLVFCYNLINIEVL